MLAEIIKYKIICPNCGSEINNEDYIYRHKAPSGYHCSKCGYIEFFF